MVILLTTLTSSSETVSTGYKEEAMQDGLLPIITLLMFIVGCLTYIYHVDRKYNFAEMQIEHSCEALYEEGYEDYGTSPEDM